jgi:hypothetical protein
MSDEVRELVDRRWAEYGIDGEPADRDGAKKRSLRQLIRR